MVNLKHNLMKQSQNLLWWRLNWRSWRTSTITSEWKGLHVQFVSRRCRVTSRLPSVTMVIYFVGVVRRRWWTTMIVPRVDCPWMAEHLEWKVIWDLYLDLNNIYFLVKEFMFWILLDYIFFLSERTTHRNPDDGYC